MEDDLTNNRRKYNIASPIGCMYRAEEFLKLDIKFKYRIRGGLQYIIYGRFARDSVSILIKRTYYKGLIILCAPLVYSFIKSGKYHRLG